MIKSIAVSLWLVALSVAAADFEVVAQFDAQTPPGNIAVGTDGRIFMSVHEFYGKPLKLVEVLANGEVKPYPNQRWASAPEGDGPGLRGVLGLNVDREGILWLLDGAGGDHAGRIVAWNTRTESLHKIIYLAPPVAYPDSFLNDLAVDREHEFLYIADTASPDKAAIIAVDLTTGRARRLLEGSDFTRPEDLDMRIDGKVVTLGGNPARIGVNPISIDPTNTWLYFGAMTGTSVYRMPTAALRDTELSSQDLAASVQRYGDKAISDGITVDNAGNVYISAITDNAVGVTHANGDYQVLLQDAQISWPDGFAIGPDNWVYLTINELHRSPVLNGGEDASQGAFKIIRFKALSEALPGR